MGRLIKNHWARLIVLTGAVVQIIASIEGFIWQKVFWDFATTKLNHLVTPIPYLQVINLVLGLAVIAFEWPIKYIAGSVVHRHLIPRILAYPIFSLFAFLMYQSTNAGICYLIGTGLYLWGFVQGETVGPKPWTVLAAEQVRLMESGQLSIPVLVLPITPPSPAMMAEEKWVEVGISPLSTLPPTPTTTPGDLIEEKVLSG